VQGLDFADTSVFESRGTRLISQVSLLAKT